jgi:hypothetical protein
MNPKAILLVLLGTVAACVATTPAPFSVELRLLDRVASKARSASEGGATALQVLEGVAVGQAGRVDASWGARIGIGLEELRQKAFEDPSVRAHALRAIGSCPQSEALRFLEDLRRADLAPDGSGELWPSSQIALSDARMNRILDPMQKIDFLRGLLTARTTATPAWWTVDELCNRGAADALPEIEKSIRRMYSGQSGEDDVGFCKARMDVLSRDPDRVKALASVFGSFRPLAGTPEGHRMLTWSINQLISMRSTSADAELDSFVSQLGDLLKSDPSSFQLSDLKRQIDTERKFAK